MRHTKAGPRHPPAPETGAATPPPADTLPGTPELVLELSTDIVRAIADRAREFHAQEGVVFPELSMSSTDDWAMQVLAEHGSDLTFQELRGTINELEPDQQVSLIALTWLGRGDFSVDEWEDALNQARERWTPRTAEYLISTPLLADYLEEGLALLGLVPDD